MRLRDILELLLLSMLWGASFMFMRIAAPEFGPIPLMALRVLFGALSLLPILIWRKGLTDITTHIRPIFIVSILNSALPFCLLAYATLIFSAGFTSIINATSPLWATLVAILWLKNRPTISTLLGLAIGFIGVITMVWDKLVVAENDFLLGLSAGLVATLCYGTAAIYSKVKLTGVNSLALATGSLLSASALLLPLSLVYWPAQPISSQAWLAMITLAIASTGFAYILYFRLIANAGPDKAIMVTYIVPIFGMLFGALLLDESITPQMISGCLLILFGASLATGLFKKIRAHK